MRREFYDALSIEVIAAGLCFILFPIEKSFPPRQVDGFFAFFFNFADTINLSYNDLPSLHVALSLVACAAFAQCSNSIAKVLFTIWAILITASTLFIHEHHLLDIVIGVLLAVLAFVFIYRPLSRKATKDNLEIEWLCLSECAAFARRHHRYLVIALIIYKRSIFTWKKSRVLRTGFCLLQIIDDYLDGDRKTNKDPENIAANIAQQFETGSFMNDRLSRLAAALWRDLETNAKNPITAKADVVALIRHMMLDRRRVCEELIYSEKQLQSHHRLTFKYSMNLLLNAVGSDSRTDSFTELLDVFGWCSTMRDLKEDLEKGLINIPADVLNKVDRKVVPLKDYQSLVTTNAIRDWLQREFQMAWFNLIVAQQKIVLIDDAIARRIFGLFVKSMIGFAQRFDKKHSLGMLGVYD